MAIVSGMLLALTFLGVGFTVGFIIGGELSRNED